LLTSREEHGLRVSENRVLRRIFGPKRDEVTGGWRKLYNEGPPSFYTSPSIITVIKSRRMRWAGYGARMGEKKNEYRILVRKREPGRLRRWWGIILRWFLREIGWGGMDWIDVAQDRNYRTDLVNTLRNLLVP
jgi:hypothetical protein